MIFFSIIRKYKKQYMLFKAKEGMASSKYEDYVKDGCVDCTKFFNGVVEKCSERLTDCYSCKEYEKRKEICDELETIALQFDKFIEEDYAYVVFQYGICRKPKLINIITKKVVSWDEAYGSDFTKISNDLRHSLVGLIEGYGQYKFKRKIILYFALNKKYKVTIPMLKEKEK